MKHGDLCTLVLFQPCEVTHGHAIDSPEGLLFARHHRNGWVAATDAPLHTKDERILWLPGHLPAEHELVQAAIAHQALTR